MRINSITTKIVLIVVTIITLTMTILGIIDFLGERSRLYKLLNDKSKILPLRASITLADPFWNIDIPLIKQLTSFDMTDDEIYAIIIADKNGKVFYQVKRDKDWKAVESEVEKTERSRYQLISSTGELKNDNQVVGKVEFLISKKFLNQSLQSVIIGTSIKTVIISILIIFLMIIILDRILIVHIKELGLKFKEMSEGEGDLTKRLEIKSADEISQLAGHFNKFIVTLNGIIRDVKTSVKDTYNVSDELTNITANSTSAVIEISSGIKSITNQIKNLDINIENSSKKSDQIMSISNTMEERVTRQRQSLEVFSLSIDKMVQSISKIAATIESIQKSSEMLIDLSKVGDTNIQSTNINIDKVSSDVKSILEIIQVLDDISSQTGILSLNASIQAAHAGGFGTGFAVVAHEIRELATSTKEKSEEIQKFIKSIVNLIQVASDSSIKSKDSFGKIYSELNNFIASLQNIYMSIREIKKESDETKNTINMLNTLTYGVNDISNESIGSARDITEIMKNGILISKEVNSAIGEIDINSKNITSGMQHVLDLNVNTKNSLENLLKQIEKFKIE